MARNHGFNRRIEGGRAISDEAIEGVILALRKVMIGGSHLSSRGRKKIKGGALAVLRGELGCADGPAQLGWSVSGLFYLFF